MRSVFALVCQSLMVVSYWMPGSPQIQAASAIAPEDVARLERVRPPRRRHLVGGPVARPTPPRCMKSSVTRTEWLAFWKKTEP